MANITITHRKTSGIVIMGAVFEDETFRVVSTDEIPAGAVLARETSTGILKRFDPEGEDGLNSPLAVLTFTIQFDTAGDRTLRPAIAGRVRRGDLVDINGAALTQTDIDTLRRYGIIAQNTRQLTSLDNS